MRLFVAVDIPISVRERIKDLIHKLSEAKADVKWVEMRHLHVTMKFLGDVREDQVNDVVKVLQDVASKTHAHTVSLQGLGIFGSPPRVLWVDMHPKHQLLGLMKELNTRLDYIHKDTQAPEAHLTIGRFRSTKNASMLRKKLEMQENVKAGELHIEQLVLKKSVLGPTGPVYTDLNTFNLGSV